MPSQMLSHWPQRTMTAFGRELIPCDFTNIVVSVYNQIRHNSACEYIILTLQMLSLPGHQELWRPPTAKVSLMKCNDNLVTLPVLQLMC